MKKFLGKLSISINQDLAKILYQFIKFGFVGLANTIISLAIYYIFVYINKDLYIWGTSVGWVVSVANAFIMNRKFVFKNLNDSIIKTLFKTYVAYGISFIISLVLMFVQVELLGVSEMIAPIINLVITVPLNFILNKFWAFK